MLALRRTSSTTVALWLALTGVAFAQSSGIVTGRVVDETGGVLPGVTVNVEAGATELSTVTDGAGTWRIVGVPPGPATLTFRLINFSSARRDVIVTADGSLTVDLVLTLSLTADVVVTARRTFQNIADLDEPAENLVGIASAASVGAITAAQLEARPIMRPGEVLEAVPGLIVSQHSGEGKANQYYLRGFNLDHGSDFATTLAGVPLNVPAGAHFHGYSDSNVIIPELVSGVQFKKGPYFAEDGDFSAAGSANINYVNVLDGPVASISAGGQGWGRFFGAASPRLGDGNLLIGVEAGKNDGPWTRPDDLRKVNGILRYSRGDAQNGLSITGMSYSANWYATDQVPVRAIESGLIDRFGSIDPSDRGRNYRHSIVFDGLRSTGDASTRVTAFGMRYGLNLIQNFTYFLANPVDGDQFEQADRRTTTGVRLTHRRLGEFLGRPVESAAGAQLRHDNAGIIGLYDTVRQRRTNTVRQDALRQTSLGLFGESEIEWSRVFRTTFGLRGDVYRYDIDAINPLNAGAGADTIVSPKLTVILGPWQQTEFYANWGAGFHSNDVRGATLTVDPRTGEPVETLSPLVKARGGELGVRTVRIRGLQSTVALWFLDFDSELLFIGDSGVTEAHRPSHRYGLEWANYLRLSPWMTAEADLSFTAARFTDDDPAGNAIPGSLNRVVSGALTVEPARRVFGSIRMRHFGPRPLVEDNSVTSESTTIWNSEVGVTVNARARLSFEAFNLFNSDVSDIDYFYASRLRGEPLDGVDDLHTHPSIPRTARVTLQVTF